MLLQRLRGKEVHPEARMTDQTYRVTAKTRTIRQQDGPNHLGLWYNALREHQMGVITSGCVLFR